MENQQSLDTLKSLRDNTTNPILKKEIGKKIAIIQDNKTVLK